MLRDIERRVIMAIATNPLLTDEQQAEVVKIKRTTFTAMKNRLKSRKFFFQSNIPFLQNFNCDFLRIGYGSFNKEKKFSDIKREMKEFMKRDNIFFFACDREFFLEIGFVKSFANYEEEIEDNASFYVKNELLAEISDIPFYFFNSKIYNFFDYSSLFRKETTQIPFERQKLTKKEINVFRELITNPNLLDTELQKKTKIARQTFSKFRKNYEGKLFKTTINCNLKELGFKFIAMIHCHFHPLMHKNEKEKILNRIFAHQFIFLALKKAEFVLMGIYNEGQFEEYQKLYDIVNNDMLKTRIISFSIEDLELLKNFEFKRCGVFFR